MAFLPEFVNPRPNIVNISTSSGLIFLPIFSENAGPSSVKTPNRSLPVLSLFPSLFPILLNLYQHFLPVFRKPADALSYASSTVSA